MSPSPLIPATIFMDERIMPCDICGSRFTNERALMAHKRYHKRRPASSRLGPRTKRRKGNSASQYSGRRSGGSARTEPAVLQEEEDIIDQDQDEDDDTVDMMGLVDEEDIDEDELVREMSDAGDLHLTL
jgi:hypothetical protein